jgi:hypothetical protein
MYVLTVDHCERALKLQMWDSRVERIFGKRRQLEQCYVGVTSR